MNTSDINYTPTKVKSVPLFPRGINRHIDADFSDVTTDDIDFDVDLNKKPLDNANGDNTLPNPPANIDPPANNDVTLDFEANTYSYTDEGLIDTEGKVIKTVEQLTSEGLLDDDGNVIDPTTKEIKIAKQVVNNDDDGNSELTLLEELQQLEGYNILDEAGQPKVYEDSTEGLQQYINDVAEFKAKKAQEDFFNTLPEVKAFATHLLAGGTRESYFGYTPKNYKTIELGSLDAEQKANLVYEDYRASGLTEARAKALVDLHKKQNEIDALAEESLNVLREKQTKREEADAEAYKAKQEKDIEDTKKYWDNVKTTVNQGKLGNIIVPDADKQSFLDFISKPVDENGNTQYNLALQKETTETELQLAYWRYKGYDFNKMVKNLVKSEQAKTLRDRVNKSKGGVQGNNKDVRGGTSNVPVNSVSVDNITM